MYAVTNTHTQTHRRNRCTKCVCVLRLFGHGGSLRVSSWLATSKINGVRNRLAMVRCGVVPLCASLNGWRNVATVAAASRTEFLEHADCCTWFWTTLKLIRFRPNDGRPATTTMTTSAFFVSSIWFWCRLCGRFVGVFTPNSTQVALWMYANIRTNIQLK